MLEWYFDKVYRKPNVFGTYNLGIEKKVKHFFLNAENDSKKSELQTRTLI